MVPCVVVGVMAEGAALRCTSPTTLSGWAIWAESFRPTLFSVSPAASFGGMAAASSNSARSASSRAIRSARSRLAFGVPVLLAFSLAMLRSTTLRFTSRPCALCASCSRAESTGGSDGSLARASSRSCAACSSADSCRWPAGFIPAASTAPVPAAGTGAEAGAACGAVAWALAASWRWARMRSRPSRRLLGAGRAGVLAWRAASS